MELRPPMKTLEAINEKLESKKEPKRSYLGVSYAGEKCDRKIWLTFRWAKQEHLDGRVRRLLDRGHREEAVIVKHLKNVGVDVKNTGKKQIEVYLSPWVKGHADGIVYSGLKESPTNKHILEMKTSSDKAFQELVKKGVKETKPVHYTQMQLYMLGTGIERAFYWVTNKNNDEVYTERIKLDREFAEKARDRATALSVEDHLPFGVSVIPSWYECKMCPMWGVCHNHEEVDHSCRTCEYGKPREDGTFFCDLKQKAITNRAQEKPCSSYKMQFDLERLMNGINYNGGLT